MVPIRRAITCILCITLLCFASAAAPGPRLLQVTSKRKINRPRYAPAIPAQSDSSGDIFSQAVVGSFPDPIVVEIPHSSADAVIFAVPQEGKDRFEASQFSVTPLGDVYILANHRDTWQPFVFAFDSRGQVKSKVRLEVPPESELRTSSFAASDNGNILLTGFYREKAAPPLQGRSLMRLFDSSGKLLRDFQDTFDKIDLPKMPTAYFSESVTVPGEDGNFYLLHSNQVLVLSPGGAIVKRITINPPAPGLTAFSLSVSGGQAALWFAGRPAEGKSEVPVEITYSILDLSNGKGIGWYRAAEGLGAALAFSRSEGFMFFAPGENGDFTIYYAQPR